MIILANSKTKIIIILFLNPGNSGNVGLAILQCVNMVGMCQWGMRQTAEIENQMTSVERVLEYADLPSEPPLESEPKHRPPTGWPEAGEIVFRELNFKYSDTSSYVLKDINIKIKPKVGKFPFLFFINMINTTGCIFFK